MVPGLNAFRDWFEGYYSLSAILLDNNYYQLLEDGTEVIDGLPVYLFATTALQIER